MIITNTFDTFTAPAFVFFGVPPPASDDPDFETKNAEYEKNKNSFMELAEIKEMKDNIVLKFSLGSVLFDLINSALQLKILVPPESPKLMKRMDKEFMDFAMTSDNEGQIEMPDSWLPYIDKVMNDDQLYSQAIIHGELISKEPNKKTMPLRSRVLNSMPKIRDALLVILPS